MMRRPCSERLNVKMRNWTKEEDAKKTGIMKRGGKSCRLKWSNCSGHDDSFTPEEEDLIVRLHAAIGSRWSMIAQQLPGRTDNDVKNCWNTKLRKKLSEKGIDPVTHKPFSQVLADYANIGTLPEAETSTPQTASNNSFIFLNPNQFQIPHQQQGLLSNSTAHLPTLTNPTPENSALSFAWRDFLIEDPFPAGDARQAENYEIIQREEEKRNNSVVASEEMSLNFTNNNGFEASSSSNYSDTSFVEAMLDRQKDMLLEFPGVLEESFFY